MQISVYQKNTEMATAAPTITILVNNVRLEDTLNKAYICTIVVPYSF